MSKERKMLKDEGPNGELGRAKGYKTPVGDTYEKAVAEGKATSGTFSVGKPNDVDASVMASRATKLQTNAEAVRTIPFLDDKAGVAKKLASDNPDGNPKKRTDNSWGVPTEDSKKK